MTSVRPATALLASLALVACGVETVVHGIQEREANKIIELLADADVDAQKLVQDSGRTITYAINVPATKRLKAIRVLNRNELPQRTDKGYTDIFSEGGMIPTSSEEKAKKLAALEGEIERQLKLVDGILDVQVQVVMPDESALRTGKEQEPDTTASVTIKYMPGPGGSTPISTKQVERLVSHGVEKLVPEKVEVFMTPVLTEAGKEGGKPAMRGGSLGPFKSQKQFQLISAGIVTLILLLAVGVLYYMIRLKTVRGRLMHLQSEISKARRRPDSTSTSM